MHILSDMKYKKNMKRHFNFSALLSTKLITIFQIVAFSNSNQNLLEASNSLVLILISDQILNVT